MWPLSHLHESQFNFGQSITFFLPDEDAQCILQSILPRQITPLQTHHQHMTVALLYLIASYVSITACHQMAQDSGERGDCPDREYTEYIANVMGITGMA